MPVRPVSIIVIVDKVDNSGLFPLLLRLITPLITS
jgi:hypothetical protein